MVTFADLNQLIYDELKAVATANTSVSTPDDHVDVLDRTLDIQTPFFGFEWTMSPNQFGMGGNVRNGDTSTDSDGDIDSVEKIRDYTVFVDFGVVIDGDDPSTRDEYLGYVQEHFGEFVDNPSALHNDVHRVREDGTTPENMGDDRDVGFLLTYQIEFQTMSVRSLDPMKQVDWDVDVSGEDVYPEKY